MPDAPKLRWFRFSLRTMFVAIAVFACWLGWNVHVVQNRLAVRRLIIENGGVVFVLRGITISAVDADGKPAIVRGFVYEIDGPEQNISLVRRLLGDEIVDLVLISHEGACGMTNKEIAQIFPESKGVIPDPRQEDLKMETSVEDDDP